MSNPTIKTVTVSVNDQDWSVELMADGTVDIETGGVWAGSGEWNGQCIEECDAVLGEAVYDAIEDALAEGADDLTSDELQALLTEAGEAGDTDGVALVERAIAGDCAALECCALWVREASDRRVNG